MSERRSNTICAGFEWPDHHYGDDPVNIHCVLFVAFDIAADWVHTPVTDGTGAKNC